MNAMVVRNRGRSLVGGLAALALLACAVLLPSAAFAAAPSNDDAGAATSVGSLPYSDTLDTTEATTAADDPFCSGNGHTVWYAFTPTSDVRLDANTFGSSYDTTISVYSGSPGSLTQLACNDDSSGLQSQVLVDVTAGQTYYVMVGSFYSGAGGSLTVTLREAEPPPPAPELSLSIDRGGFMDRNGSATVNATLTCNQPMFASAFGTLTQTFARRFTIQGFGGTGVACEPGGTPVKLTMFAYGNPLRHGPAQAAISAFACSQAGCASDSETADVVLRGGRSQ